MNIAVVGAGYVGLTISAGLASMGHHVTCVEKDRGRLVALQQGRLPFYEPGLADLITTGLQSGNLSVCDTLIAAVEPTSVAFIAVGTPSRENGEPDLSALEDVAHALASIPHDERIIAIKSTVPAGTTEKIGDLLFARCSPARVAHTPEFLSQGSAVTDFFHPSRVIIGTHSQVAARLIASLYQRLGCPILVTDPRTAEMIKYASNSFLATKVSFINEIAEICEQVGADVATVAAGMGLDPRISPAYFKAGIGFGGSCLPKDVQGLAALAKRYGLRTSILDAVLEVNRVRRRHLIEKLEVMLGGLKGKNLALLGLAFKGGTSDVRESPALDIAARLLAMGAVVRAFDPAAEEEAGRLVPGLVCCPDLYETAEGADAIVILTDWPQFERLDWKRLRQRVRRAVVLDGRGLRIAGPATAEGFAYTGPAGPPVACDVPSQSRSEEGVVKGRRWED